MEHQSTAYAVDLDFIMETYSTMVYRLAFLRCKNKYDADDIYQEVFMRLFSKAPAFESEEHAKAWLLRVTINCTKKLFDSSYYKKTVPLDERLSFSTPEKSDVFYAVQALPAQYKTIVHLFYYEGFKTAQIAGILKTNESTIRTRLQRARERLSKILEGGFENAQS